MSDIRLTFTDLLFLLRIGFTVAAKTSDARDKMFTRFSFIGFLATGLIYLGRHPLTKGMSKATWVLVVCAVGVWVYATNEFKVTGCWGRHFSAFSRLFRRCD